MGLGSRGLGAWVQVDSGCTNGASIKSYMPPFYRSLISPRDNYFGMEICPMIFAFIQESTKFPVIGVQREFYLATGHIAHGREGNYEILATKMAHYMVRIEK